MSKVLVTESHLNNIAEAIRAKNGASTTYRPGDMAAAIQAIPTGITPTGAVNITQNGAHDVTEYASANVNVQPNLQSKTATENGTVTPDQGYDGLSSVVVNVSGGSGKIPYYNRKSDVYIDSSGDWDPSGYSNTRCMFWEVTPNTRYIIYLPSTVGSNIRAAAYDIDVSNYTGPGRYSGQLLLNATPTSNGVFSVYPQSPYLVVATRDGDLYAFLTEQSTTL